MKRIVVILTTVVATTLAIAPVAPGSAMVSQRHSEALINVSVATGFIPNVQFAPYYLAQDQGFYRSAGLNVTMNYDRVSDPMAALAAGKFDFAIAGADQVIAARAAGIPVTYVMAQFEKYPVGAMSLKDVPLKSPADLRGKTIGISAPGSATDIGLRALLQAGNLKESDVKVTSIGFTETEALLNKRVNVAMTFITNEPVQVKAMGHPVNVLPVYRFIKLISTGVVVSQSMLTKHPARVQAFVTATLKGLRLSQNNPNLAFSTAMKRTPEITGANMAIQRKVLTQTLKFMVPLKGHPYGWTDPVRWATTARFLVKIGLVKKSISPGTLYTNTFATRANIS